MLFVGSAVLLSILTTARARAIIHRANHCPSRVAQVGHQFPSQIFVGHPMRNLHTLLCLMLCLLVILAGCGQNSTSIVTENKATPSPTAAATSQPAASPSAAVSSESNNAMKRTPSGLQYQDLVIGTGPRALPTQKVRVYYKGQLPNGTVFDSTKKDESIEFPLKDVIEGWVIGIGGGKGIEPMRVGGKRKLIIPPELGYGNRPHSTIPPNSTLIFEIELLGAR